LLSDSRPNNPNHYDSLYASEGCYWGTAPSSTCDRLLQVLRPKDDWRPKLLDLGCGEGRNAIYLAKHGFEVSGLDCSPNGLRKTQEYAKSVGLEVKTILADIRDCRMEHGWDVIFSTGTMHYLSPSVREERFEHFKEVTTAGGLHVISVFVNKPFVPRAPDPDPDAYPFRSGELMGYYWDWEILFCAEEIFGCRSGGVPHKHAVNRIIAKKIAQT